MEGGRRYSMYGGESLQGGEVELELAGGALEAGKRRLAGRRKTRRMHGGELEAGKRRKSRRVRGGDAEAVVGGESSALEAGKRRKSRKTRRVRGGESALEGGKRRSHSRRHHRSMRGGAVEAAVLTAGALEEAFQAGLAAGRGF